MSGLATFSSFIGWVYFAAWSISFYPQVLLNYRRKRVDGFSIDFATLNVLGFLSLSIYSVGFFASERVKRQYRERHGGKDNTVQPNDVAFAVHALLLSSISLGQTFCYPRASGQHLSQWNRYVLTGVGIVLAVIAASTAFGDTQVIDLLYALSYFKLYITVSKYVPQMYLNYARKSTVGWSIVNILLDFTGGLLSLIQLLLDSSLSKDWSGITGNPIKFGLSVVSLFFDIIFILQHYVFYRHARGGGDAPHKAVNERRRLLGGEEEGEGSGEGRGEGGEV